MFEYKKGDVVEGYRVEKAIGLGAASAIYLVQDPRSKEIRALKHVEKESDKDQRFLDQAESEYDIAKELDHPGVRKVFRMIKKRAGLLSGVRDLYLEMEYVDGLSLERYPDKQLTWVRVVDVFHQVAEALAHMHDRGYVHADMKPNNVILQEDAVGRIHAKIIDLGQSCPIGTVKERIQGTPDYIAPEQVHRRAITPRTDIYNFGATMYWAVCRQHIPTAMPKDPDKLVGSVDDHMIEKARPAAEINPRIHPRLNDLIMKCVQVEPERRPESMHWVADQMNLILGILRAEAAGKSANSASHAGVRVNPNASSVAGLAFNPNASSKAGVPVKPEGGQPK